MNTKNNTTHKTIMRRVYYSYALSILISQAVLAGIVFAVSLHAFAKLVYVAKVWENFLRVPVGSAPLHIVRMFIHSDALTLLSIGLMIVSVVVVIRHLPRPHLAVRDRRMA